MHDVSVCLHNIQVIRDSTGTHKVPTSFLVVQLETRLILVLRRCTWSAEATQGETNNNFITMTPRGATDSDEKLRCMTVREKQPRNRLT